MHTPKETIAAVLEKIKKPLILKKIKIPELKTGQVLVKIYFSGICGSQRMEINGKRGKDKFLPHLLGHEGTGVVIKTGKLISKIKVGDKVILGWIKSKGLDAKGGIYTDFKNKKINSGPITTFSNYSIISENRIVKLPKHIPMDVGVLFGCAFPTGMGMIFYLNKKYTNKKIILIIGLGGVGFSALLAALAIKTKKIIVIDNSTHKLSLVKKINKKVYTINYNSGKVKEKVLNLTKQKGADACIECAGSTSTIELGFKLINKKNGKLIFASHPKNNKKIKINPHELIAGKKIEGSWGGFFNPARDINKISLLARKNKKIIKKYIINKKYSLNSINKALKDKKTIRPIVKMY